MFTGIVSALGQITQVSSLQSDGGLRLVIEAPYSVFSDTQPGDSIAVQGACMTVVSIEKMSAPSTDLQDQFTAIPTRDSERVCFALDVSSESLACTVGLDTPGEVNLEPALRVGDRLGGHWVSGHVDGVGEVLEMRPCGESIELRLRIPPDIAGYVAVKGSLAVNGVSLTVNRIEDDNKGTQEAHTRCSINLIPHTLQYTTLRCLQAGDRVNLEVDLMARYMARLFQYSK